MMSVSGEPIPGNTRLEFRKFRGQTQSFVDKFRGLEGVKKLATAWGCCGFGNADKL
jgi:hypothetical protein